MKRQISRFAFMSNPCRVIKLLAFVTGLCIVSCTTALAQQSLFVYLQSENQPFYVQIGDKVYSSSPIGHLVIAGLTDKTCNLEIGFPQHTTQPQRFSIPLGNKDQGYQLVKSGSHGWALYNWQTDETIRPLKEAGSSALLYGERKKDDAFATLMAAVVNDSAVLYTSIVKKESVPVPSVAVADANPAEKQPVAKTTEKPVKSSDTAASVKNVETVTAPSLPPAPVPDTVLVKNETIVTDTTASAIKTATADLPVVTKYDPKERGLTEEKPAVKGVAKIQQQTKDGEMKMVFVDSSESPASVVTVYITDDKKPAGEKQVAQNQASVPYSGTQPVDNTPASTTVKTDTKQETAVQPAKQEATKAVKKEENPKNDPAKETTALTKEEIANQIKKETWRQAPEKKAATGDTVTIILESRQLKKGATTAEEPQPLYRPKQEPKTEPVKPAKADTAVVQITAPARPEAEEASKASVTPAVAEKKEVKQEPTKPVGAEKPVVKTEPDTKKENEGAPLAADSVKKAVMPPVDPKKDTTAAIVKTESQQPVAAPKTAEPEKPKAAEQEKKAEAGDKLVMINSDCVKLATDNDIDKMRLKILVENDLQKKLAVANKYFKTMCLYARHIKALSELFVGDEAKYKFLEMAYPFAADTANFKQLYELLSEEMYVTKFKKLVRLE